MDDQLYRAHVELGTKMTPPMVQGSCALAEARLPAAGEGEGEIRRSVPYGDHPRQLLDIHLPAAPASKRAALLFVHGGGFVGGDRDLFPGSPFYGNIARFAARQGHVGVLMSYRLAPETQWPGGAQDVAAAVAWLRGNADSLGIDPGRVFLIGQSAGATHIADYIACSATCEEATASIAGAILLSAIYDVGSAERNKLQKAYFGEDDSTWRDKSALAGLLATNVPLLCAVAEFDIPDFQAQAGHFAAAWLAAKGSYPPLLRLTGHNHISTVLHLGAAGDNLSEEVRLFIDRQGQPA